MMSWIEIAFLGLSVIGIALSIRYVVSLNGKE